MLDTVHRATAFRSAITPIPVDNDRIGLVGTGGFRLHHAIFSDTILVWTNYDLPNIEPFLDRLAELFCEALALDTPLRGFISFGRTVMDAERDIFVGIPIIEAAGGESEQS